MAVNRLYLVEGQLQTYLIEGVPVAVIPAEKSLSDIDSFEVGGPDNTVITIKFNEPVEQPETAEV